MIRLLIRSVAVMASFISVSGIGHAQQFPTRPIRMVVPFAAGGPTDLYARLIARKLDEKLKNPVLVENRPGGNSVVGTNFAAQSAPDGYTLIYFAPAQVSSVFVRDAPFDVLNAFVPIGSVSAYPLVLTISGALPARNLAEFVAFAKANSGKLNYGTTAGGATLAMEVFKNSAGIDLTKVEYKGGTFIVSALLANEVQANFGATSTFLSLHRAGKLRIVGVAGRKRLAVLPEVPTMAELGYEKLKSDLISAVMAPAGVPPHVVQVLAPIVREAVASPELEKALLDLGAPLLVDNNELMRLIREEIEFYSDAARLGKVQQ